MTSSETKKVTLCGRVITLTKQNCHICEEPCWFEPNVFVCNDCSEINLPEPHGRHGIIMSEYRYHGDINSQR